jgi:hypothetical protein
MLIVSDSDSAQEVKFIPRSLTEGVATAYFIDKTSKTSYSYSVTLFKDRYYLYFSEAMADLVEGHTYEFYVKSGSDELYRGFALCTNQSNYSINNGEFTQRSTTNDYIILE